MPGGGKGGGGGPGGGSAGTDTAQENLILMLTSGGVTFSVGVPQDSLQSWIVTKPWDLNNADKAKFIDRIILHLTNRVNQTNMSLEIYGSDSEDGPFALLQTILVSSQDPITPDVQGFRYFQFRFIDRGVKERWRLHGFEVYGELGGDEF